MSTSPFFDLIKKNWFSILKTCAVVAVTSAAWIYGFGAAQERTKVLSEVANKQRDERIEKQSQAIEQMQTAIVELTKSKSKTDDLMAQMLVNQAKMQQQIESSLDHEKRLARMETWRDSHMSDELKTQRELAALAARVGKGHSD